MKFNSSEINLNTSSEMIELKYWFKLENRPIFTLYALSYKLSHKLINMSVNRLVVLFFFKLLTSFLAIHGKVKLFFMQNPESSPILFEKLALEKGFDQTSFLKTGNQSISFSLQIFS